MSAIRSMALTAHNTNMDIAAQARNPLTQRQRIALYKGVLSPQKALAIPDDEITFASLRSQGVGASNFRAARLDARSLKEIGVNSALALREVGFDALDLNDAAFCSSSVAAFGADNIVKAFLIEAGDAIALAGSVAMFHLHIDVNRLLEACSGSPEQAKAVLQQCEPKGGALCGVIPSTLLDSGLRAAALSSLGYHADAIRTQTDADATQLRKLGF
jgi:hypothetical protein